MLGSSSIMASRALFFGRSVAVAKDGSFGGGEQNPPLRRGGEGEDGRGAPGGLGA